MERGATHITKAFVKKNNSIFVVHYRLFTNDYALGNMGGELRAPQIFMRLASHTLLLRLAKRYLRHLLAIQQRERERKRPGW